MAVWAIAARAQRLMDRRTVQRDVLHQGQVGKSPQLSEDRAPNEDRLVSYGLPVRKFPPESWPRDLYYVTTLKESLIGKWQAIFIVRYPSGDPKDMDHIEDALMAKLM